MPSPQRLLPWLLGGAVGAAGILQGLHWRSSGTTNSQPDLENQLRLAAEENRILKRENESLRSLAQGGGEMAVPQEWIDRVEKEIGLRFRSSPVVHRIPGGELYDRVAAAIESRYGPSGIDDRQEAYQLIGWLRPGDDLLAQLAAVRATGAVSWFDEVSGEAWVTERYALENIPDQAALIRLLTRILFHQHFPPPPEYPGDDAARALEALHSGAAASAEARFYAASALSIGFMPLKENTEAGQLVKSLSPFMQGLITFPATEGKHLADGLYMQGNEKFTAAFRPAPQTTRAIFFPGEPRPEPQALELPQVPETPFLTETAGQLGLQLWLEPNGDAGAAEEIASSWKNDRYVLFPDGEASTAVLWDIELESSEAADRLQSVIRNLTATVDRGEKRHISVTRPSPVRIRFLNTASPTTADMLGGK